MAEGLARLQTETAQAGGLSHIPEVPPEKDLMGDLVRYVIRTDYEDLPTEVVEHAKMAILDTLGVTVAGSSEKWIPEVVELVKEMGGRKQSTIIVYGGKVPAPFAALAMGPMARALDLGATALQGGHIAEHVLPAVLPAAELQGGATGKELITAFVLGCDVMMRLCDSFNNIDFCLTRGFVPHFGMGSAGATAGVAKLRRVDENTMWNAIGISNHVDMTVDAVQEGTSLVRLLHGFVAENAIKAVLLAEKGATGPKGILIGKCGFYKVYLSGICPTINLNKITSGMGVEFTKHDFKRYPACHGTHYPMMAASQLVKEYHIAPADIASVHIRIVSVLQNLLYHAKCWHPETRVDCQFSIPYTTASVLCTGHYFLDSLTDEAIAREDVRKMMTKITVEPDDQVNSMTIKTTAGVEYIKEWPVGNCPGPDTWDELIEKFRMCMSFAAKPIPDKNIKAVIDKVRHLEEEPDVRQIISLLTPS